jgi:RHS repeat-associated protein
MLGSGMRPDRLRAAFLAVLFLLAGGLPAFAHRGAGLEQQLRLEQELRAAKEEAARAQLGAALRASLIAESTRFQTDSPDAFQLFGGGHRHSVEHLVDVAAAAAARSTLALWRSPALPRLCTARSALPAGDDPAAAPDRFRLARFLKTRVRGFELACGPQHQANQRFSCEIASDLFHGAWTDPVTGIAYHRARWYDARTASWLSEDPAGTVDSSNLYAFVGWGPQGATDPLGLAAVGCPRCIAPFAKSAPEPRRLLEDEFPQLNQIDHFYLGGFFHSKLWAFAQGSTGSSDQISRTDPLWWSVGFVASMAFSPDHGADSAAEKLVARTLVASAERAELRGTAQLASAAERGLIGFEKAAAAAEMAVAGEAGSSIEHFAAGKTLDLAGASVGFGNRAHASGRGYVYVLRDLATGDFLKVGKTTGGPNIYRRFNWYRRKSQEFGIKVEATYWQVNDAQTAIRIESEMRAHLEAEGFKLPWDKVTQENRGVPWRGLPWQRTSDTPIPQPVEP